MARKTHSTTLTFRRYYGVFLHDELMKRLDLCSMDLLPLHVMDESQLCVIHYDILLSSIHHGNNCKNRCVSSTIRKVIITSTSMFSLNRKLTTKIGRWWKKLPFSVRYKQKPQNCVITWQYGLKQSTQNDLVHYRASRWTVARLNCFNLFKSIAKKWAFVCVKQIQIITHSIQLM